MDSPLSVAFLGLGKMGVLMAGHALDAGHRLTVWNRSPGRAGDLIARGAREASSPADAARGAEVVVTMLFDGDAVRSVLLGGDGADGGAAAGAAAGTLFVDSSTTGPDVARDLASELAALGHRFVDAPVAGSTPVAEQGELTVLAGGAQPDVEAARPLLETWGSAEKSRRVGGVGSGQAMKLVINLSLAVTIAGIGECLRLSRDLGLDLGASLDVLGISPFATLLGAKRAMLEAQDYEPATFGLDAMTKDVRLAVDAGDSELAVARTVLAEAERALVGYSGADMAALAGHLAFEGEPDSY